MFIDKISIFLGNLSKIQRLIIVFTATIVYFVFYALLLNKIGDSIIMLMMIPAVTASAVIGLKSGLLVQVICFSYSILFKEISNLPRENKFGMFIGFGLLLIVNFVVGVLRNLQSDLRRELKQRKIAEEQRETTLSELRASVEELEKARSEIRTLSGLLPICSSCHSIRDNDGSWLKVEEYIAERSDAEFSHGICPDCAKKLYPDYIA